MTIAVRDKKIASVDSMVARERNPGVFVLPQDYTLDATFTQSVAANAPTPRARMADIVKGYYATMQGNDGTLFTGFADGCRRMSNGVTDGLEPQSEAACGTLFKNAHYAAIERVRERQILAVDEAHGVVVASAMVDLPKGGKETLHARGQVTAQEIPYPYSRGLIEAFKIVDGKIARIEGVSVFLPYRMPAAAR